MNNLHRELAPISESAWKDLGDQVRAAFALYEGARRVVDVSEPKGLTLGAVGTGPFLGRRHHVDLGADADPRIPTCRRDSGTVSRLARGYRLSGTRRG
ncbi:encapsulin [Saccharopolyspora mangrovi]|uniref:encapsulin n=1 Tax=Saccharopolyspora mangrovi TaxID=3082379 RepID=UPI00389AD091